MKMKNVSLFEKSRRLASLVAKDYAGEFFKLLIKYRDISASEAAARLGIHIKTAQDFLEGLEKQDILEKKEAEEGKRPYFRYSLKRQSIQITIDLKDLYNPKAYSLQKNWKIKENKNSGAIFREGRGEQISAVLVFRGKGRSREQKQYNLTERQGRFLFHLPFPTGEPCSVREILKEAGLSDDCLHEIMDIVEILISEGVVLKIESLA
jgi:transposase